MVLDFLFKILIIDYNIFKNYKHPVILTGGINDKHLAILIGGTSGPQPSARISPVKLAEPTMDGA